MATTLKRVDSKTSKEEVKRNCIICCDNEDACRLLKPCRVCPSDYCSDCLLDMFHSAIHEPGRIPPKCCALIQIHTVIADLMPGEADAYRSAFEEWISPVKTYCPAPTCSAFIPDRCVPEAIKSATSSPLGQVIREILTKVNSAPSARFFRGELPITELPGFNTVVKRHIDLSMIQDNVEKYGSIADVTADMHLILSNAIEYNGVKHPVTAAAHELFRNYTLEVSNATTRLVAAPDSSATPTSILSPPAAHIFACPKCHIAICTSCKQIDHTGSACDTTAADGEIAMLASFGYKRCPRCKAGVKKMFGCSHMQCICGAHWCYYCKQSTEHCGGDCDERALADDEEEDDYDGGIDDPEGGTIEVVSSEPPVAREEDAMAVALPSVASGRDNTSGADANPPATMPPLVPAHPAHHLVNLDAGGDRRWAETDYDFGDEPDDNIWSQVWSCRHNFSPYIAPAHDTFNRGDLSRMECNRCFIRVFPKEPPSQKAMGDRKRRKIRGTKTEAVVSKQGIGATDGQGDVKTVTAMECSRCRIVVCPGCMERYKAAEAQRSA